MSDTKYGIGQPVLRTEDPILVRGEGRYTDDVNVAGQAYAVIVRSRHAHGVIKKIDTDAARKMPGVLAVYTGADLAAAATARSNASCRSRTATAREMKKPTRHALADRQGALRRRPGRLRGRRDAQRRRRMRPRRSSSTSSRCRP